MPGQGEFLMAENTAHKIQPALTPDERQLQYIELTHAAIEKAAATIAAYESRDAAARAKVAAVCTALIDHERARPEEREKLAEVAANHERLLDLVVNLAAHRTPAEAGRLGQGQGSSAVKTAGHNSDRPFAAAKSKKQAGARLFQQLGLAVPADE